jgi:hypothetical protein
MKDNIQETIAKLQKAVKDAEKELNTKINEMDRYVFANLDSGMKIQVAGCDEASNSIWLVAIFLAYYPGQLRPVLVFIPSQDRTANYRTNEIKIMEA